MDSPAQHPRFQHPPARMENNPRPFGQPRRGLPTAADSECAGMRLSLSYQPKLSLARKTLMVCLLHYFIGFRMDDALWIQEPNHRQIWRMLPSGTPSGSQCEFRPIEVVRLCPRQRPPLDYASPRYAPIFSPPWAGRHPV
jgi:hypothetical protein